MNLQELAAKRVRKGDSKKQFWRHPVACSLDRQEHFKTFASTLESTNVEHFPFAQSSYEGTICLDCQRIWREGATVNYAIF